MTILRNSMAGSDLAKGVFPVFTWQSDAERYEGSIMSPELASTPYYLMYERIKGCNAVLDYIDEAIGTQQEIDHIKAEALSVLFLVGESLWRALHGEPTGGRCSFETLFFGGRG